MTDKHLTQIKVRFLKYPEIPNNQMQFPFHLPSKRLRFFFPTLRVTYENDRKHRQSLSSAMDYFLLPCPNNVAPLD